MNSAYLLIGGNIGNKLNNLKMAVDLIEKEAGKIFRRSSVYETAAWGNTDQPSFFNQALYIKTALPPRELLEVLLGIENKLGRVRNEKMGPREMDIDILFYNDEVIVEENLTIPHPEIAKRRFVLIPMNEIAPDYVHPVFLQSISTLLENCPDQLAVSKWKASSSISKK